MDRSRRRSAGVALALLASSLVVFAPRAQQPAAATTWNSPVVVSGAGTWRAAAIVVSQGADTTYPHACAVTTTGGVKCWGHLQYGEGGFGGQMATASYPINMKLAGTSPVARVSQANGPTIATGGDRNTCVIYDATGVSGGVQCSGMNRSGAVGRGDTTENVLTPVPATRLSDSAALTGVTAIVGGGYDDANQHFCALKNGGVYCWGYNGNGQLGDNTTTSRSRAVVAIPEGSGVTQIAAGAAHSCAIYTSASAITLTGGSTLPAGTAAATCWGYNAYGALGDNSTTARSVPVRVLTAAGTQLTGVDQIAGGVWHTCARTTTGSMRCWGHNGQGMLGIANTTDHLMADTTVVGVGGTGSLSGVTSIAAGYRGSCAVVAGGELRCWGQNSNGQLGDGTTTDRSSPVKVIDVGQASGSDVVLTQMGTASPGSYVTCGLKTDGRALCWGRFDNGTLGAGKTATTYVPGYVNGAGPALWSTAAMAVSNGGQGSGQHACAVTTQQQLKCWGYNTEGQAGVAAGGTTDAPLTIPLDASGAGANPVPSTTVTDGSPVAASDHHTCVVFNSSTVTGGVQCFGYNDQGQLGAGNTTLAPGVRKAVVAGAGPSTGSLLSGVTQISAGSREDQSYAGATCAVAGGGVFCWGNGDPGLMGDGTATDRSSPVQVPGMPVGSGIVQVAVGRYHACALYGSTAGANAGKAKCWGWNEWGQLSNGQVVTGYTKAGFLIDGTTATFVKSAAGVDMTGIDQIAVGAFTSCFLRSGAVSCAGYGAQGELGLGSGNLPSTTSYAIAAVAPMNSGVTSIASGNRFTCGVKSGTPYCVGKNSEGQLGRGTTTAQEYAWAPVVAAGETSGSTTAMTGVSTTKGGALTAGGFNACARKDSGELSCWGYETSGQLGDGDLTATPKATFTGLSCNTASTSTWGSTTAPAGTTSATFYLTGGGGAGGDTSDGVGGAGGSGGVISATVPIVAGQVLWAKLGCGGTDGTVKADGYTKGGTATSTLAGGGGGSSALCIGTATASCGSGTVVAIAGGGGGGARGSGTGACRNTNGGVGGTANLGSQSAGQRGGTGFGGGRGGDGDFDRATTSLTYPTASGGAGGGGLGQGPGQSPAASTANNNGGLAGTGTNGNGNPGIGATTDPPGPSPVSNEGNGGDSVAGANSIYSGAGGGGFTGGGSGAGGIDGSCTASVWAGGGGGGAGSSWIKTAAAPVVSIDGAGQGFTNAGGLNGSCADTLGVNAGYGATAGSGARGCHGNVVVYWNQDVSTIGGTASPAANAAGWNNSNVTVSFTCASVLAVTCSSPTVLSTEGTGQSVTGTVTDGYGRSTNATVSGIKIDKTNPTGTGAATAPPNGAGWYKDDVSIAWTCSDPGAAASGVKTCPANSTITGEGASLTATATVVDNADNTAGLTSPAVKIDRTAPATSVSATPTWSTSDVTVTLTPSDNLSGVASTKYTVDGGAEQSGTSIPITTDGVHTLTYSSTDAAGNVESTRTATVRVDKTAPTISAGVAPAPNAAGWNNSDATVTFTCSDGTSGVASCPAATVVSTDTSSQVVSGTAVDVAGNSSGTSATVKLDKAPPTISGTATPAPNANGWNRSDVTVSFSCNDPNATASGVKSCPSSSVLSTNAANQSVSGTAVDNADNSTGTSVTGINIDKVAPTISASISGTPNGAGYRHPPVTVTFTCTDALSGIDAGACPAPVVLTAGGSQLVEASVTDRAGNESAYTGSVLVGRPPTANSQSVTATPGVATSITLTGSDPDTDPLTFAVDAAPTHGSVDCTGAACTYTADADAAGSDSFTFTVNDGNVNSTPATVSIAFPPPTISGSRSPAANGYGWNNEPVTVSFTCSSAALASCTSPVTVNTDGTNQSVTGTAEDAAGLTASTTVSGINIDRLAPSLSGVATTSPNAAGWFKAPVTMTWTCTDAQSGLAPGACPADQTTTGEGPAVATTGSVTDKAGNVASISSEAVQIDLTAPSTTVSTPPAWSHADVTLTLDATDNLSGIDTTTWSVDGGATHAGTSPVVSGQGVHSVSFRSTDVAGNVEAAQTVYVAIDTTAPSITASKSPAANANGWNRGDVTVTYTCSDAGGSEVAGCQADQSFTGEVDTTAIGSASDNAGNVASTSTAVRIDRTAPTVSVNQPTPNANGWFDAPVEVTFSCTDTGGSGIGDGGCPATQMFSGEGAGQAVTATGSDVAGNQATATGDPINLDETAPTISGAATTAPNGSGGYYGNVTVQWTCADALSGINATGCPAAQTVTGEGVHVLSRSVTDKAGNTSTAEVTIRIDHDPATDPGTATGIVTDSVSHQPIAGVLVRLHTTGGSLAAVYSTTTGTDGRYSFPIVDDGTYLLSATKWGTHLQTWFDAKATDTGAQPLTFTHGSVRAIDMELVPGYQLTGLLTGTGGAPVSGATVRLGDYSATSGADGRYTITGMVAGTRTLTVLAAGYQDSTQTVAVPATATKDVVLTASPTSTGAKGTVIAASPAGLRLPGAVIKFYVKGAVNPGYTATTGSDGRYQLPTLPAGVYEVSVSRAYTRWLGNILGRSGGQLLTVTATCATPAEATWGDPCAALTNFTLPTA